MRNTAYITAPTTLLGQGCGAYLAGGVLFNTIVAGNFSTGDGGGVFWAGGSAGYNDVWGSACLATAAGCGADHAATGNPRPFADINTDPHFAISGDVASRYHLRSDSPCIDKGSGPGMGVPSIDYDRQLRPLDDGWDIGFDEAATGGRSVYLPACGAEESLTHQVVTVLCRKLLDSLLECAKLSVHHFLFIPDSVRACSWSATKKQSLRLMVAHGDLKPLDSRSCP